VNIDRESPDYGRIRQLAPGEAPGPDEVELTEREAAKLRAIEAAEREAKLRELREARDQARSARGPRPPVKFRQTHRRKHR
jgi:hypothetical protein